MKNRSFLIVTLFLALMMLSSVHVSAYGTSTAKDVVLPYVNFNNSDVTLDGKVDSGETGFTTFTIDFTTAKTITVNFRQNGDTMHVVMTSENPGWLAIGWHNAKPASTTGSGPMVGANIVIGGNNQSRDDTGAAGSHQADATNNIISSFSSVSSSGAAFEFLFPLASTDSVDQPLTAKAWGYFIFAEGLNSNIDNGHGGSDQSFYLPSVYIQSSAGEAYKSPSGGGSAPFADPAIIVLALGLVAVGVKIKRKY